MIPVVDIVGVTSHAKENPISTALTVLVLVLIALGMIWIFKTFPKARAKLTFALFAIYLAGAGWLNWQFFKPRPAQVLTASSAMQSFQEINYQELIKERIKWIDVVMLNENADPRPGDRLSFQEINGDKCIYHGKVEKRDMAIMDRKACPDGMVTTLNVMVPLDQRRTNDNHYKAYIKSQERLKENE